MTLAVTVDDPGSNDVATSAFIARASNGPADGPPSTIVTAPRTC